MIVQNSCPSTNGRQKPSYDNLSDDSDDGDETLNTIELLREGEVKTTQENRFYTILMVGETGTGKTTLISLLSNVFEARPPRSYVDARQLANEAGGGQKGSQTQRPFIYEFISRNGVRFRIVDTPGLADTHGIARDEAHRQAISTTIRDHVEQLDAVLLLANGTVPRLGVATDYVFNVLATMFPRNIADNIGIVFTNVTSKMNMNFDFNSLPTQIHRDMYFCLDNPLGLQKKLETLQEEGETRSNLKRLYADLKERETAALGALVHLFDWLDTVSPVPTTAMVDLYEKTMTIDAKLRLVHASMTVSSDMHKELKVLQDAIEETTKIADLYKEYRTIVNKSRMLLVKAEPNGNSLYCTEPSCFSNCSEHFRHKTPTVPRAVFEMISDFLRLRFIGCSICRHPYSVHATDNQRWEEVCGTETRTDEEGRKRYEDAQSDAERKRIMRETAKRRLSETQKDIAAATRIVSELTSEYAKLSLSGSFTGQIYHMIKLLDVYLEAARGRNAPLAEVQQIENNIADLQRKLELLNNQERQETTVLGMIKQKASLAKTKLSEVSWQSAEKMIRSAWST